MSSPRRRSNKHPEDVTEQLGILAIAKCSDIVNTVETRSSTKPKSEPQQNQQVKPATPKNNHHHQAKPKIDHQSSLIATMMRIAVCVILLVAIFHATTGWLEMVDYKIVECQFRECCHSNDGRGYIRYEKGCDILRESLQNKVHGQPFITKKIYNALKAHMSNNQPPRPLVMYFSGWTGTGKTYVAKLIASSLYKEGMKSRFVKHIIASYEFPTKIHDEHQILLYRQNLRNMIRDTVKQCDRSLIILDELDKLPPGIVDSLQPLLDYIEDIDGVKYNKAIFIFLSNTGSESLNKLAYKMFREGKERTDLVSKDVEEILVNESFNETGGLRHSALLRRYSIGVLVPFLPLERKHVKLCIEDELERLEYIVDDREKLIEDIADEMTYFPDNIQLYSKSGCKGVHDKLINYVGPPADSNRVGSGDL